MSWWGAVAQAGSDTTNTLAGLVGSALQFSRNRSMMRLQQKLEQENMEKQYSLNQQSLRDSTSSYMAGLEKAGVNPMLVISGGVPNAPQVSAPAVSGSSVSAPNLRGADFLRGLESVQELRGLKAEADISSADASSAKAEADARKAEAELDKEKADIELEAIRDEDWHVQQDGKEVNPTRQSMRQMIRNDIERRRYTNSKEHAMAEDAVNAVHGGTSAYSAFQAGRLSRERRVNPQRFMKK